MFGRGRDTFNNNNNNKTPRAIQMFLFFIFYDGTWTEVKKQTDRDPKVPRH